MTKRSRTTPDDELLTPVAAARAAGVSARTLERWAKSGKITAYINPNGHRRYKRSDVEAKPATPDPPEGTGDGDDFPVEEAVGLYEQGLSIRKVAEKVGLGYGVTRRMLLQHTTLRDTNGLPHRPIADRLADTNKQLTRTVDVALAAELGPADVVPLVSYLYELAEHGHALACLARDQADDAERDSPEQTSAWADVGLYLGHTGALFDTVICLAGNALECFETDS